MKMPKKVFVIVFVFGCQLGCGDKRAANPGSAKSTYQTLNATPDIAEDATLPGGSEKPGIPTPPFKLAKPTDQSEVFGKTNISKLAPAILSQMALKAATQESYPAAVQLQWWSVKLSGSGLYNLACFYSLNNQIDEAFYCLQEAALKEGTDSQHVDRDPDMENLRNDSRYARIRPFLRVCEKHFQTAGEPRSLLYMPKSLDTSKPTPVVLMLHGRGSNPENFLGDDTQAYADEIGVPIISLSGTKPTGPRSFIWAVDARADFARMNQAIEKHAAEAKFKPLQGQWIAVGFSEGAQVGLDVAVRYPEHFAGAIAMSPGATSQLEGATPTEKLQKQKFIITVGKKEAPGNLDLADEDSNWLKEHKATVELKKIPDTGHSLPPDFDTDFPKWIKQILAK